jgi:subtilisin family serine protease
LADQWAVAWHHKVLGVLEIWARGNFGDGVTVALLDSGLAVPHGLDRRDFEYLSAKGVPIAHGDVLGHGTFCASAIASYSPAAVGIAPHARLVSMRVLDTGSSIADVPDALRYLLGRSDVDIVSCSFVMEEAPPAVHEAVKDLTNAGKVVVAAAGDRDSASAFPELVANAITVAAVNQALKPLDGARMGKWIDVAAPGAAIPVLRPNGSVSLFGQSSAAAAVASGCIALVLAGRPAPERRRIGQALEGLLKATAKALPGDDPDAVGRGLVDPLALIAAADSFLSTA